MKRAFLPVLCFAAACKTVAPVEPPQFDYPAISRLADPGERIPLTIQRGANIQPSTTQSGILFFASNRDGSGDIWLRDLSSTVSFPVVRHPAEQTKPSVPLSGNRLAFVSYDLDASGDIRIAEMKPAEVVRAVLAGSTPPNLWTETVALDDLIDAVAEELPVVCRGSFAENDPQFSPDGKYLYFTSDRCSKGSNNLFRVPLDGLKLAGKPELLVPGGAAQPSLNLDGSRVAFVSTTGETPELVVMDLRNRSSQRFKPPGISMFPVLSPDGAYLYYTSVRRDTNENGKLDALDAAGIYVLQASGQGKEQRLVDDATSLHGLTFSFFIGGSLLYAAESYQNVNIYFTKPDGIVPREAGIDEQFLAVSRYKEPLKKLLALDALERYFGETPEAAILEGRYLQARIDASAGAEKKENEERLLEARKRNPYTDYTVALLAVPREESRAEFIQKFIDSLEKLDLPADVKQRYTASALDELSRALESEGRKEDSLAALKRINADFAAYFRRPRTLFRQAVLEMKMNPELPQSMITLIAEPGTSIQRREELISEIIQYFSRLRTPSAIDERISNELKRSDLPQSLRSVLEYVKAKSLFDRGQNDEALAVLRPLESKFAPDSGMFVRTMQLVSFILERKRDFDGAYEARTRYGGSYRPEMGVRVGLEEYREILDLSDRMIRRYLSSARSVVSVIDEADAILSRRLITRTLEGTPVQNIVLAAQERPVFLSASDIEVLGEFCNPKSRAAGLVATLGQKDYITSYVDLCAKNGAYFSGQNDDGLRLESARVAADMLYIVSYANANVLNILFYNMKRVNLFEKFHAERSIEYHRLKIDIAMERNRTRIEWDRKKIALLDPRQVLTLFTEGDPFDATAFNEVVHGYKFAANEARAAGELSFLYGYAYALMQKSQEREAFYDRLALEGAAIPEDQRRAKKQDVLRDLKTAEYMLQYILYVDPTNADAYLLLGWMYQYIDDRRGRSVARNEGYLDRLVNFITRTRAAQATDGQYFIDIYRAYFPDRLYETNVELYRQAIHLIGSSSPEHESLGDLNLNLANNYFQLLNFQKAVEHYNRAEDLSASATAAKAGLFYFNRGRSYYYEGSTQNAARDLKRSLDYYTDRELKPAELLLESTGYRLGGTGDRREESERLRLQQDLQKSALDGARLRVSLVGALYGLALWESGRYAEAARAYESADYQLRKMADPDKRLRAGVLNYLSMARQEQRRIDESDQNARSSQEITSALGLRRDDDRYQPQSIGGRLLGCVLPYGEDFSVIGDGRNPYGLSTLRQYELSTGILLENRLLAGDRSGAMTILEAREDLFTGKDGDVRLGKTGALTVLNRRAFEEFSSTHFQAAADLFGQAASEAQAQGFLDQARRNYLNRFHALFAWFDSDPGLEVPKNVARALEDLESFRSIYRESARAEFIAQEQTENPDFEYDPAVHDAQLEARVTRRLRDFFAVEAGLYYYRALSADRKSASADALKDARADYERALALYERLISSGEAEPSDASFYRLRLNRIELLHRLGRVETAMSQLQGIIEDLEEFALIEEEFIARGMLASLAADRFDERREAADGITAREQFLAAAEILRDFPVVRSSGSAGEAFYRRAADYLIRHGDTPGALQLLEASWNQRMHDEYVRYPISFEDQTVRLVMESYLDSRKDAVRALKREQSLRFSRQDSKEARQRRTAAFASVASARKRLAGLLPLHAAFFEEPNLRIPEPGKTAARLFYEGGHLSAFVFGQGRAFFRVQAAPAEAFGAFLRSLPARQIRDLFLIPDRELYALDLEAIRRDVRPDLPAPVFISRLSDPLVGSGEVRLELNQFNSHDETTGFVSGDVMKVESGFADDFFAVEAGRFRPREFLLRPRNISMAYYTGQSTLAKDAFAYEVLRAGGAYAYAVTEDEDAVPVRPGAGPMTGNGFRIWGAPGFQAALTRRFAAQARDRVLQRALTQEKARNFRDAAESYRLAASICESLGEQNAAVQHRVRSAGVMMLVDTKAGEATFAALLESLAGNSRVFVLEALISSQVKIGQYARAEETGKKYSSDVKGTPAEGLLEIAEFLRRLETASDSNEFPGTSFQDEFERLRVRLSAPGVAPAAIETLLRRALHPEALVLARAQEASVRGPLTQRISLSASLLAGSLSQDLQAGFADEEPGLRELAGYTRRAQEGDILSAAELREDIDPAHLSSMLLSVLVLLYAEAADGDPGYLAARLIHEALELEAARSPERACSLAVLAAEKYSQDPDVAVRFLDIARTYLGRSVQTDELRKRYALTAARFAFLEGRKIETESNDRMLTALRRLHSQMPAIEVPALTQFGRTLAAFLRDYPAGLPFAHAAVEGLKAKAIQEKKAQSVLDLEVMSSEILSGQTPVYEAVSASLLEKLPAGQTLTAMIQSRGRLYRVRVMDKRITLDLYQQDGRAPRVLIARGLYLRSRTNDHDLAQAFRRMVTARTNIPAYFYLPSGLRYAPMYAEPGDRIFLAPSLAALARKPLAKERLSFENEFSIHAPGPRLDEAVPGEESWFERLRAMEESALGSRSAGSAVLHVYSQTGLAAACEGVWFLSVPRHRKSPSATVAAYEQDLESVIRSCTGPGIAYADTGSGEWYARFLRAYYDRETGIPQLDKRYLDAQVRMRRAGLGPLNVRMVSPAFVSD